MDKYTIRLKDRQTGKVQNVLIDAKNIQEAKAKAMATYGTAYEVL